MKLYWRLLAAGIRARMQYKLDFIISTLLFALITLVDFLTVATIIYRYKQIHGWTIWEVALLSGVASASYGLYRVFCSELNGFESYLVRGDFDILLLRPWPTLATLLTRNFDLSRAGAYVQGLTLTVVALTMLKAPVWLWLYALVVPVAGAGIVTANCLMAAASGFWLTKIDDLMTFTVNAPSAAANYPMDIFPKWLRWLFTGVLPVAAISWIPMSYALGKGGQVWYLLVPFVAAAVALFVTYRYWRWGERHYQSTGT